MKPTTQVPRNQGMGGVVASPCPRCQNPVAEGSRFCRNCGVRLTWSPSAGPAKPDKETGAARPLRQADASAGPTAAPAMGPAGSGWRAGRAPVARSVDARKKTAARQKTERRIVGRVRGLQQRDEMEGQAVFTVWSFTVERYDRAGNRLSPVPVELRGLRFSAALTEGDEVEIRKKWKPGKVLRPKRVMNLTTGVVVKPRVGLGYRIASIFGWMVFMAFLIGLFALITFVLSEG